MIVAILLVVLFITCDSEEDRINLAALMISPLGWMIFLWVVIP